MPSRRVVLAVLSAAAAALPAAPASAWTSGANSVTGPSTSRARAVTAPTAAGTVLSVDRRGVLVLSGPLVRPDAGDRLDDGPAPSRHQTLNFVGGFDRDPTSAAAEVEGPAVGVVAGPAAATAEVVYADGTVASAPLVAPLRSLGFAGAVQAADDLGDARVAVVDRAEGGVPVGIRLRAADGRLLVADTLRREVRLQAARAIATARGVRVTAFPTADLGAPSAARPDRVIASDVVSVRTGRSFLSFGVDDLPALRPRARVTVQEVSGGRRVVTGLVQPTVTAARVELRGGGSRRLAVVTVPGMASRPLAVVLPRGALPQRVVLLDAAGAIVGAVRVRRSGFFGLAGRVAPEVPLDAFVASEPFEDVRAPALGLAGIEDAACLASPGTRAIVACLLVPPAPADVELVEADSDGFSVKSYYAVVPAAVASARIRLPVSLVSGPRLRTVTVAPVARLADGTGLLAVSIPAGLTADDKIRLTLLGADGAVLAPPIGLAGSL